jgi:glycosyltransferase involved in cell wall biosynthesis
MKILILNWRDIRHPLSGGAEVSLFEHAKYWQKKGNEIVWFSSHFPKGKHKETIDGIKIIRKGSHYTAHLWAFFYFITKKFKKVDLVIDSFHFIPFFTPLYIKKEKIVGLINEIAGKVWFANLPYPFAFIGYHLEPKFFYFYQDIPFITASDSTKKELNKVNVVSRNIQIIPHGINIKKVKKQIKKDTTPTIAFLGRVSIDKGIKDALIAFAEIKENVKDAQLWVIGKEEKEGIITQFLNEVQNVEIKKDIKYFGFVEEKTKFELLKRSWILIHPSKKEGWGLNVIEAAAQGTPTVGYNIEGLRDSVQHKKTGILVKSGNPSLLSKAIITIIGDKEKKQFNRFSRNAVKWSQNFNWSISTKLSLKFLNKLYDAKKTK